ncbi:MAG TPA: hypothetical protein PKX15_03555 [Bacteroidales bacterium]|nr:hypothetical protein [Bacteroidales bacterium]
MTPISFCINTAINERYYLELLFRSLVENLSTNKHEIIVYVENDNQGSIEFLKSQKTYFPDLKIIINSLPIPIGYARNINLMFEMAKYPIVSYLQSDMVICSNYDIEILKYLKENTITSATRIEPPLHPPSSEKIILDFGLDPKTFNLEKFTSTVESYKKHILTNFWFAPFTLYKKIWLDIGGHDTLFRRSREDSDILFRLLLSGYEVKQVWNALVYHFTCTSSRGIEWWTEKAQKRTRLQSVADQIEYARFLRKWGRFYHPSSLDDVKNSYFYHISTNIYNTSPRDFSLLQHYFHFQKIYIENLESRENLRNTYNTLHNPANKLLNISDINWKLYQKYYRILKFEDIFTNSPINDDIILNIDLKNMPFELLVTSSLFSNLQDAMHEYKKEGEGEFEIEIENYDIKLIINNPINRIKENIIVNNPPIDDIKFEII